VLTWACNTRKTEEGRETGVNGLKRKVEHGYSQTAYEGLQSECVL